MFDKNPVDRLRAWHEFRNTLENSVDPIQDTIDLYSKASIVNIMMDPYDDSTWLDPWELLNENMYCDFATVLGIGYTLSLTDRFSQVAKEIHICTNKEVAQTKYLLYIGEDVIGYDRLKAVPKDTIGENWKVEMIYQLPSYQ